MFVWPPLLEKTSGSWLITSRETSAAARKLQESPSFPGIAACQPSEVVGSVPSQEQEPCPPAAANHLGKMNPIYRSPPDSSANPFLWA